VSKQKKAASISTPVPLWVQYSFLLTHRLLALAAQPREVWENSPLVSRYL